MNVNNFIGLNAENDVGIYLSVEDVEYARVIETHAENTHSYLHMKSGAVVKVYGNAYYMLGLKKNER